MALFACESEGSCKLVATEAVRAAGGAAGCVLALESSQLSSKAALQVSGAICKARMVRHHDWAYRQLVCLPSLHSPSRMLIYPGGPLPLQAELVNFVRRVPGGTVVVNRLDQVGGRCKSTSAPALRCVRPTQLRLQQRTLHAEHSWAGCCLAPAAHRACRSGRRPVVQLSPELLSVLVDGLGQGSLLDAPDGSGAVSTAGEPGHGPLLRLQAACLPSLC